MHKHLNTHANIVTEMTKTIYPLLWVMCCVGWVVGITMRNQVSEQLFNLFFGKFWSVIDNTWHKSWALSQLAYKSIICFNAALFKIG